MQLKGSPRVLENIPKESLEKIVTDVHRQISEEKDDTIDDSTYKRPPYGHEDKIESEDEVLMKRITKIKQAPKPSTKKLQMRSKKTCQARAKKERRTVKKFPSATKHGQFLVAQPDQQKKSPTQQANAYIVVPNLKLVQKIYEDRPKIQEDFPDQNVITQVCCNDR